MNTNKILCLLTVLLLIVAGCDYNDKYFDGYDDADISNLINFEGEYTGDYPEAGYFSDRNEVESNVNKMLGAKFLYCDKGSVAKVSLLFGDITPGLPTTPETDITHTLTTEDYDSMGEESGQPGKFDNFDANMDVDAYLKDFLTANYSSMTVNQTITIIYQFYASGATADRANVYKKTSDGWEGVEAETFTTDISYTLETEDYDSMGEASGEPGRYDNFDANMDIDFYLTVFLKNNYPYAKPETTAEVTYKFYAGGTTDQSSVYKYNGSAWYAFDPYEETIEVSTKIAEMEFDGTTWELKRLLGGSLKFTLGNTEYAALHAWAKEHKPKYMSTLTPDVEEFYFGVNTNYNNINNKYSTWSTHYNIDGELTGKTDDEIQEIMDERIKEGISKVLLPYLVPNPDSGLSYQVYYKIYSGRGDGMYYISFMYNEEKETFEAISGVFKG